MKKEFRILAHEHRTGKSLTIHEVYYANGKPVAFETDPFFISGNSIVELWHVINQLKECYEKPILCGGKKFPAVYMEKSCDVCGEFNFPSHQNKDVK